MMHPLLSPRLYAQSESPPLPPLRTRPHRPVRAWMKRRATALYLRFGTPAGFVLGVALAWWIFVPEAFR